MRTDTATRVLFAVRDAFAFLSFHTSGVTTLELIDRVRA